MGGQIRPPATASFPISAIFCKFWLAPFRFSQLQSFDFYDFDEISFFDFAKSGTYDCAMATINSSIMVTRNLRHVPCHTWPYFKPDDNMWRSTMRHHVINDQTGSLVPTGRSFLAECFAWRMNGAPSTLLLRPSFGLFKPRPYIDESPLLWLSGRELIFAVWLQRRRQGSSIIVP